MMPWVNKVSMVFVSEQMTRIRRVQSLVLRDLMHHNLWKLRSIERRWFRMFPSEMFLCWKCGKFLLGFQGCDLDVSRVCGCFQAARKRGGENI